ncbi:hypothetical protein NEHOM01_1166 [Nematocida homosporus]|uniref:uncharacterized protein n=1 Tax=Nematocida homosporus TaxID=1912981 RepID=UPI00221F7A95|nr:uncharacterized protein NEHOM01_1166 [Nematocida homosporus]KAI5185943.1 hypothetical protein NEHOM01_1166 [Nematocida homosporus]
MPEREVVPQDELQGFEDVYYQEYRSQGSLVYTGDDVIPDTYATDSYPGKDSTSYEYITYNEAFSTRTIIFKIPFSHFRRGQ